MKVIIVISRRAFTLTELLVVIAVIALLISILLPCLATARKQCHATICRSNIRQLHIANTNYAITNKDNYVLAARDLVCRDDGSPSNGGRHRWHGVRESDGVSSDLEKNTFDPTKGPLSRYLNDGKIKECPAKVKYVKDGALNAHEAGCGGYGYNSVGVGSRAYQYGCTDQAMRSSMKIPEIENPSQKIMFTDTAFVTNEQLIEYSFCEPPKYVLDFGNGIREIGRAQPSIHFRHLGKTNVVWCDGHVTAESLDFPESAKGRTEQFKIGWFGPDDNSLFRPWN